MIVGERLEADSLDLIADKMSEKDLSECLVGILDAKFELHEMTMTLFNSVKRLLTKRYLVEPLVDITRKAVLLERRADDEFRPSLDDMLGLVKDVCQLINMQKRTSNFSDAKYKELEHVHEILKDQKSTLASVVELKDAVQLCIDKKVFQENQQEAEREYL